MRPSTLPTVLARLLALAALWAIASLPARPAFAQTEDFTVTLDTSELPTLSAGNSYYVDFQLNQENGGGATIWDLAAAGGTLGAFQLPPSGSASGDPTSSNPATGLTLGPTSPANFINEFAESVSATASPGAPPGQISFNVAITPGITSGGADFNPDRFLFDIFSWDGTSPSQTFYSNDSNDFGIGAFVALNFEEAVPAASNFETYSYTDGNGQTYLAQVTPYSPNNPPVVPESPALALLVPGLAALGLAVRKRGASEPRKAGCRRSHPDVPPGRGCGRDRAAIRS